jgi:Glycosyl hydrolase family 10
MGVMRFLIHPPNVVDDCPEIFRAYLSGWDGRVFPTRVDIDGNVMACRRPVSESGKLHVAWPVEGFGRPVLSTSSLPEREQPYILAVELARGRISQVRDQLSAWELQGLSVPAEFRKVHREAHRLFAQAVAAQPDLETASELAQQAIRTECGAADLLTEAYTRQRLTFLWNRSRQPPAMIGCRLDRTVPDSNETELFTDVFAAAAVPIEWKRIEPVEGNYNWDLNDTQVRWCEDQKLLTFGGPLIDLSPSGLPQWLWQWEHDVVSLQSFVCDFVETAIRRYYGRIRNWEITTRANSGGAMTLSEEDRLSLTARTLEVARQVDEEIQLLIGIDQPWGDYQARGHHRLSPFQFVDAIVRSGVGLSALNLEFAIGYQPRGTAPRDRLMISQLIDRWSTLGIPLYVTLAVPSRAESEPQGDGDLEVPPNSPWREPWSDSAQSRWIEEFVPLLMPKQAVVGVFWAEFTDGPGQRYPGAGLVDDAGVAKAAFQSLKSTEQFDGKTRSP